MAEGESPEVRQGLKDLDLVMPTIYLRYMHSYAEIHANMNGPLGLVDTAYQVTSMMTGFGRDEPILPAATGLEALTSQLIEDGGRAYQEEVLSVAGTAEGSKTLKISLAPNTDHVISTLSAAAGQDPSTWLLDQVFKFMFFRDAIDAHDAVNQRPMMAVYMNAHELEDFINSTNLLGFNDSSELFSEALRFNLTLEEIERLEASVDAQPPDPNRLLPQRLVDDYHLQSSVSDYTVPTLAQLESDAWLRQAEILNRPAQSGWHTMGLTVEPAAFRGLYQAAHNVDPARPDQKIQMPQTLLKQYVYKFVCANIGA